MNSKIYESIAEQVHYDRLPNGLPVYVINKPDFAKSMAFFATKYGGADRNFYLSGERHETPAGVAHFLEHKMFDMEDGDALTKFTQNGANANAFTSGDMTAYHFDCTENFYENLDLLLRFVSTPYFTDESVAKEQGIIGQEINMTEDSPDFVLYYNMLKCLYKDNPVRDSVCGTAESIAEITTDTLYKCHKVFYHPSNMALCVVGNVDPDRVYRMAEDILPKSAAVMPERCYGSREVKAPESRYIEATMEVGLPMFLIGTKVMPEKHGDAVLKQGMVASLALECVAGASSPLYARLYAEGLINGEFSPDFEAVALAAMTLVGGESADPEKVKSELSKEIRRVLNEGVDVRLFGRIKKSFIGSELRGLNSFDNLCYNMARGSFFGYDAMTAVDAAMSVTTDDVTEFIREYLRPEYFAMSVIRSAAKE